MRKQSNDSSSSSRSSYSSSSSSSKSSRSVSSESSSSSSNSLNIPKSDINGTKTTKLLEINNLTRNINDGHLHEIFSNFGKIERILRSKEDKMNQIYSNAYIKYEKDDDYTNSLTHMNKGQIDGKVLNLQIIELTEQEIDNKIKQKHKENIENLTKESNGKRKENLRERKPKKYNRSRSKSR